MNGIETKNINLSIKVKSKFNFGGRCTKIDIRDSELILVEKLTTRREFNLPPGLYEVSTFLGDGKRASQIVEVFESQLTEINLEPDLDYQPAPPEDDSQFKKIEELNQDDSLGLTIFDKDTDFTIYPARNYWIVQHKDAMQKMPIITLEKNGSYIQASLPISQGHRLSVTCHVKQALNSKYGHVEINISQSRGMAFGLECMLKSGQIMNAAEVASNALEALIKKYTDPTGATLAALILYKTCRLDESSIRHLIDLAKEHDWLPDAKIILALYFARIGKLDESMQLACEASEKRILLTECFSLLLDLLRYLPDTKYDEKRSEALARLAQTAPLVIWKSMYLTTSMAGD
ncbi:TPA: hypothetical protein PC598_002658 [Morganella morganii]|uniref:hypothetical protein n=1 Tax=Providencia manganoxydans TaxID=2923283 RepID=UPI0033105D0C|nr:hypothetical protein [Morganella morganii]